MARKLITPLAASLAALVAAPTANAELHSRDWGARSAQGEALVRFEPGVVAAERREARDDAGVEFEQSLLVPRLQVVTFDGSVKSAVARLRRQPGVAYAQPNFRYHTLAVSNDTHSALQWGLEPTPGVGVAAAWPRTQGAGQVIAVVDTGVDITHPDLLANLWSNPGEVPGNGLDDDGNGMADDVRGRDFVRGDGDPSDHENHGTHVSGIAAAVANNSLGVAGVAPGAQIMGVRVLDGDGSGSTSDIANGIAYAANEGAGVINLSLGGPAGGGDGAMQNAIAFAGTRGTVVVAAAGNDASNNDVAPTSPCNLPNANLICVAALDDGGNLASYSNFGPSSVDVAAPGGDFDPGEQEILSTKPSWGVPVFSEGFEAGTGAWTSTTNTRSLGGSMTFQPPARSRPRTARTRTSCRTRCRVLTRPPRSTASRASRAAACISRPSRRWATRLTTSASGSSRAPAKSERTSSGVRAGSSRLSCLSRTSTAAAT